MLMSWQEYCFDFTELSFKNHLLNDLPFNLKINVYIIFIANLEP